MIDDKNRKSKKEKTILNSIIKKTFSNATFSIENEYRNMVFDGAIGPIHYDRKMISSMSIISVAGVPHFTKKEITIINRCRKKEKQ